MKRMKWLLPLCLAALAAAVMLGWFFVNYTLVEGRAIRRSDSVMDLRGADLTPERVDALQAAYPGKTILWDIPFQGTKLDPDTTEISLTTLADTDPDALSRLPRLQTVHAEDCQDYDALLALQKKLPDCRVLYRVTVAGESYGQDTEAITAAGAAADELKTALAYLPRLKQLSLSGALPEPGTLAELRAAHPGTDIRWEVTLGGSSYPDSTHTLTVSAGASSDAVHQALQWLPEVSAVDLRSSGIPEKDCMALADRHPDLAFTFEMTVAGVRFSTDAEELDLSDTGPEAAEIESLLPYLPNLKKVIMSECGIADEDMDALNRRHEDVRFVWTVHIGKLAVRTDETYFIPAKFRVRIVEEDIYPLRYCTDMEAIDVGHMWIKNCEWAAYMPHLKYLVIGETGISDLTPLTGLKELVFLELFTIPITDYSPLVTCTALEDLNLGRTHCDPEPIAQMTWLKHLWWNDALNGIYPSYRAKDLLPAALPNTEIRFYLEHPTASGWRKLPNYYNMRDAMDMFYLDQ